MSNSNAGYILKSLNGGTHFVESFQLSALLNESPYQPLITCESDNFTFPGITDVYMLTPSGERVRIMGSDAEACREDVRSHYDAAFEQSPTGIVPISEVADYIIGEALFDAKTRETLEVMYVVTYAAVSCQQVFVATLDSEDQLASLTKLTSVYEFTPSRATRENSHMPLSNILSVSSRAPFNAPGADDVEIPEGTFDEVCERILSIFEEKGATIHRVGDSVLVLAEDLDSTFDEDLLTCDSIHPVLDALALTDTRYANALSLDSLLQSVVFVPVIR